VPLTICEGFQRELINSLICLLESSSVLSDSLERFWRLENYDNDKSKVLSLDEKKCERHFEQTTTRNEEGRFIVRLPFHDNDLSIGANREIAFKRLYQ